MAAHAVSTPDTEVYRTIYADDHNRACHYHPIESESHVLRTESSVRFMDEFAYHLRTLARLYEELGCLCVATCIHIPVGRRTRANETKGLRIASGELPGTPAWSSG